MKLLHNLQANNSNTHSKTRIITTPQGRNRQAVHLLTSKATIVLLISKEINVSNNRGTTRSTNRIIGKGQRAQTKANSQTIGGTRATGDPATLDIILAANKIGVSTTSRTNNLNNNTRTSNQHSVTSNSRETGPSQATTQWAWGSSTQGKCTTYTI